MPRFRFAFVIVALCMTLLSTAIQLPGLHHEKVIDDFMLIDDATLRGCLDSKGNSTYAGCFTGAVFKMYYRPLLSASFEWGVRNHGMAPEGHRIANLIMHTILVALVFVLFRLLFLQTKAALAAGTLFALHPLHVPVTTFIGGRTDTLSMIFLVGCAISVIQMGASRTRVPVIVWFLAGIICFTLALLAKEQSFLLIFLLPLLHRFGQDRWEEKEKRRRGEEENPAPPAPQVWGENNPEANRSTQTEGTANPASPQTPGENASDSPQVWGGGGAKPNSTRYLLFFYLMPLAIFGYLAANYTPRGTYDEADWSLALRIETVGRTLWYYVKAFVFPLVDTLHQSTVGAWDSPQWGVMTAGFAAAGVWLAALVGTWRNPLIRFFMLWTTLTLLPCTNVIPIPSQAVAPYRAVIPAWGICGLMGMGFAALWESKRGQMFGVYAFALLASCYLYLSLADIPPWKNEHTLMRAELHGDPNFLPAWGGLAGTLQREGKTQDADDCYAVAARILFPDTDDPDRQIPQMDTLALRRRIRSASSLRYRSRDVVNRVLRGRGGNYQMMGQIEKAIDNYRVALAANPKDAELRDYLAQCYDIQGEKQAEENVLREGARLTPNAIRYARLGRFYFRTGSWLNAREALSMALAYGKDGTLPAQERTETQLMFEQTVKITNPR